MRSVPVISVVLAACLSACASVPVRNAVPETLVSTAAVDGFDDIRIWGDASKAEIQAFLAGDHDKIKQRYAASAASGTSPEANILALSGGADDGAFGAGLLVGWGEAGTRPDFNLVTGISAGALIAPLIFAGRDYDDEMAGMFTKISSDNVYEANVLAGLFGGSAVADSGPLANLISTYVDDELLRRVGEERQKGRLLIVGTTNLDAQRPVFWDMGRIALRGGARAKETFAKVLLASASIPGVFPPVHFPVRANGKEFEEIHVDGGATRQVFLAPSDFSFKSVDRLLNKKVRRKLYIVRNTKIGPEWKAAKETTLAIAQRSLETLTKDQSLGDLTRMYTKAVADGIDYNLVAVPDDFKASRPAPFNQGYMRALYARGYEMGRGGIAWLKVPPGATEIGIRSR